MNLLEAIILGLIQGLTEFIPVSSSGHLVIMHQLLGITEAGLTFDVALHLGTLLALAVFFKREIVQLVMALFRKSAQTRLAWLLIFATVPAVISGVVLQGLAESSLRSAELVAANLIIVGVLMIVAERYAARNKDQTALGQITGKQALTMGLAQAAAVIPGISRSGSTITAGLFTGINREAAARFSFLLAMPITFGAILKVLAGEGALSSVSNEMGIFAAGIITAFVSGLMAIRFLIRYLAKRPLNLFAYYRFVLGGLILLSSLLV